MRDINLKGILGFRDFLADCRPKIPKWACEPVTHKPLVGGSNPPPATSDIMKRRLRRSLLFIAQDVFTLMVRLALGASSLACATPARRPTRPVAYARIYEREEALTYQSNVEQPEPVEQVAEAARAVA